MAVSDKAVLQHAASGRRIEVQIPPGDDGARIDSALARAVPDLSRARVQALLADGRVSRAGAEMREPSQRVKAGELYLLDVPAAGPAAPTPQPIPLEILHEDEDLVVLVKPAGLVVHPAPGHDDGTLVNALLDRLSGTLSGIGGVARPGIVHRLDKDVSGVMVAAKNDRTHTALSAQFTVHDIERVYEALVWHVPTRSEGTVDRPIARDPRDRKRMTVLPGGKRAVTRWKLVAAGPQRRGARLRVELETGRTHQIRVHLTSLGHPILGDHIYGPKRVPSGFAPEAVERLSRPGRILLHARTLGFTHPRTGARLRFDVAPPAPFDELLALL